MQDENFSSPHLHVFLGHGNLQDRVELAQYLNYLAIAKVVWPNLCAAAVNSLQDGVVNKHVLILSHGRDEKEKN